MGVLPDRLPGYAPLSTIQASARASEKSGAAKFQSKPGLTARAMMEAAVAGKLKALYVVGANPVKTFGVAQPDRLAGLELLVVHDMFLTETALRADVVLPAASTYEKDGTMTNTAGEVQTDASLGRRARAAQRFRPAPHPFAPARNARTRPPIQLRTPEAAFDEIRQHVAGYDLSHASLLGGRRGSRNRSSCKVNGIDLTTCRPARFFRRHDYLFTSGTLGRYCSRLTSDQRGKRCAVEFVTQHAVLVVSLVKIAVLLFVVMTALAYLTWFERKVVAHIQSRWGPYYVGAHGLLQPLADGLKFLFKEDMTPPGADKFLYILAPFLALSLALTAIALIPFGPATITILGQPTHLDCREREYRLAVSLRHHFYRRLRRGAGGWSSNSKYPLLGGLRSSAQMISYEVCAHDFRGGRAAAGRHVEFQRNHCAARADTIVTCTFIPRWHVFPQIIGFLCYFTAAIAETNRIPFDLPEAETELVAGFHTEYSSFKFAMFFMAEYANMITVSCLATILFFGGWLSPFPDKLDVAALSARCGVAWARRVSGLRHGDANMHGIARLQLAVVTLLVPGAARFVCFPRYAGDSGAVLVSAESYRFSVFLRMDARDAAALPL